MRSVFADLWAGAVRVLDGIYGEEFTARPLLRVANGRPAVDSTRAAGASLQGEFLSESAASFGKSPGHSDNMGQKIVAGPTRIVVTLASLPYPLRSPDQLTRVGTGDVFEVADVDPDGFGRATIYLTSTRRPS